MQRTRGVERVVLVLVPLSDKSLISYFILQLRTNLDFFLLTDESNFLRRLQFKN